MGLEEIPWVYKADALEQPHAMPEQHIFTLPSFLLKSITAVAIAAIHRIPTISTLICIWKRCKYSSSLMQSCFLYMQFPDDYVKHPKQTSLLSSQFT